jgi:hypothetical protein
MRVGGVDGPQKISRQTMIAFVLGEGLERARRDHASKIPEYGLYGWHR